MIKKLEFQKIRERIENGESFSSLAREFGVTPWAIQKRFKGNHPITGRKEDVFCFWEKISEKETEKIYAFANVSARDIAFQYPKISKEDALDFILDYVFFRISEKNRKWVLSSSSRGYSLMRSLFHNARVATISSFARRKRFRNEERLAFSPSGEILNFHPFFSFLPL